MWVTADLEVEINQKVPNDTFKSKNEDQILESLIKDIIPRKSFIIRKVILDHLHLVIKSIVSILENLKAYINQTLLHQKNIWIIIKNKNLAVVIVITKKV